MNESLFKSLSDFSLFEGLSFDKAFEEVVCYVFGSLGSSMTVKDSEEGDVLELGDGEICYVGVFHVSSPALHLADGGSEEFVLLEGGEFVGDGFLEEGLVAHELVIDV